MLELQSYLDQTVDSFIENDPETFIGLLDLPFTVISTQGTQVATSQEELRIAHQAYVSTIRAHGVTDLIRLAQQTISVEPDLVVGVYETHVLRNGHRLVDPYRSAIMLRRKGEMWIATSVMNSSAHTDWVLRINSKAQPAGSPAPDGMATD